jgi:diaminopimelate epimerase
VVLAEPSGVDFTEEWFAPLGRFLSTHPAIAHGTNVQLARVSEGRAEACIWERGVGRTSASGTSSCAVAVALVLVGGLDPGEIMVEMPGGRMQVTVDASLNVRLRGPVESIMTGTLEQGLLATFEPES